MAGNIKKKRKEDALELAYLAYDIFKERQNNNAKLKNGQNNAKQTQTK